MELRVVDFEILTKNYKNYQEGIAKIENVRQSFIKRAEPLKKEMEDIIRSFNSGLVMNNQAEQEAKFKKLQDEAQAIDQDYKTEMNGLHTALNTQTFEELSDIINTYSTTNNIDVVVGKMEVVYLNSKYDITENILNVLKESNLYTTTEETETI